ncbi:MAG: pseudaminic acid synthase [Lachnospiraceae bacterium]|nr:pseudaminic acid synthase [Lachnospiraceae bacterium]
MSAFKIKNRMVGDGYPAYIIAEMSANHAGSIERAKEIIREAKRCGADCIKIQTYTPDTLTIDCHNKYFQVENGTWEGENLYSLYGKAYTPWEWQQELKEEADKVGIDFLSTPFDTTAVDFLEDMGLEFYKIASFEMIDLPLLRYIAATGKPIIMSTGMATLEEIKESVETIKDCGNDQIALLKCSSAYPALPEQMNLRTIVDLKEKFELPIGLSDHSMGHMSATTAVTLGANIIEKHFCLGREIENPDASFSMTPAEFKEMVDTVRQVEAALGKVSYGVAPQEESSMVFRRSIFVVEDVKAGERLTEDNTRIIRPGYGMKPKYIEDVLGMKVQQDIERGTPLTLNLVASGSILFLTNNKDSLALFEWLKEAEPDKEIYVISNKINLEMIKQLQPEFIVSYNYKHIVPADVLEYMQGRAVNLHVSLLPYNRGSSPNFFSFLDNTPKGVTIHEMTAGLDKGRILCQKELVFDEEQETFASSYNKLQQEIMELFKENWEAIRARKCEGFWPQDKGTYHTMKELEEFRAEHPFAWSEKIAECKRRWGMMKGE